MVQIMLVRSSSEIIPSMEGVLDALQFHQVILQRLSTALKMGRVYLSITPQNTICRGPGF